MSQFKYILPSGAEFTMEAPAETTQDQADLIFYSQVAAGALVGFKPGQSVSGTTDNLAKFELSRLDRGTAGLDDTVILSIVNGLPTVAAIPSLINVPLENPITQASIAEISGTGFTAPVIGSLTSTQVQALMAQVANNVNQPATTATNLRGVGKYGLSGQQLEIAGYVKPGTWQQFVKNGPSTLIQVLGAPGIWTGLNGIYTLEQFLNSPNAQNDAQARLMQTGYVSLQAAGVIVTPAAQNISTVIGEVYNGNNEILTVATESLTNNINGQVAALVTNSSQYGTQLTAQWAAGLPPVASLASNLTKIEGALSPIPGLPSLGTLTSGLTPPLTSVKTAMDVLGKASQFAATASSTLTSGLDRLSNLNLSNVNLSNLSLGNLTNNLPSVSALTGQIQGRATALVGQIQGQATALAGQLQSQLQGQASALLAQAQGRLNSLLAQGDTLVASVQKAAGFVNTVNRATVDVAFTKILGSNKIPVPNFGSLNSASIGAALDINKAQSVLKGLSGQGTALLSQAQGQVTAVAGQLQTQTAATIAQARTAVTRII